MAQSGHRLMQRTCPLSGVKQTSVTAVQMSAFDPKRTFNCSALDYSPTQQPKLAVRYSPRALVTRRFANGYANHTTRSRNSRGFDCVWGGGNPPGHRTGAGAANQFGTVCSPIS